MRDWKCTVVFPVCESSALPSAQSDSDRDPVGIRPESNLILAAMHLDVAVGFRLKFGSISAMTHSGVVIGFRAQSGWNSVGFCVQSDRDRFFIRIRRNHGRDASLRPNNSHGRSTLTVPRGCPLSVRKIIYFNIFC